MDSKETRPYHLVRRFYEWYLLSVSHQRNPLTQDRATLKTYVSEILIREIEMLSESPDGLDENYLLNARDFLDAWTGHVSRMETVMERRGRYRVRDLRAIGCDGL